jgi:hypothetical protein
MQPGQHDSSISGLKPWSGVILLVGSFMLFIYNHQAKAVKGQKYRRTYSHHKGKGLITPRKILSQFHSGSNRF